MKTVITADSTQRIILTRALSEAAGIRSGERVEVTATPGLILISPATRAKGKIVKKGKAKIFTGEIPDVSIAEAVNAARHYTR